MGSSKKNNYIALIDETGKGTAIPEGKKVLIINKDEIVRTRKQIEYSMKYVKRRGDTTDFVWTKFKYNQPLYPSMKSNVVARVFCLATYTNIEGYTAYKDNIKAALNGINDDLIAETLSVAERKGFCLKRVIEGENML